MQDYKDLVVIVDESWLKGKNRKTYYTTLQANMRKVIKHYYESPFEIKNEQQRFVIKGKETFTEELILRLCKTPGINSILPILKGSLDLDEVSQTIIESLKSQEDIKTFKIRSKRVDKRYPIISDQINRLVAGKILEQTDKKVDIKNPDIYIDIKIMNDYSYFSFKRYKAVGGFPIGTNGSVVTLLSGGLDSPVASYMMAKRGSKQHFVFFHAYPYVGDEVKEKILKLMTKLSLYQNGTALYIVPFGEVQNYIAKHCDENYRTLLFRKYMMDIASMIGDQLNAQAILMGDALGQVSSQTIFNMSALDRHSKKMVLRPLVGFNKIEVINLAKEIETFDISSEPHDDACALFAPKHPILKPNNKYLDSFLEEHKCEDLLEKAVEDSEIHIFNVRGDNIRRKV